METHVRNAVRVEVGSTTKPVDKIDLHLYEVEPDRKLGLLQMMLRDEQGSFLVFARTKHGADRLAKKLSRDGVKTATIHGNRSQNQRTQALRGFQDGYYRVLVATDIAARGIHVEGISHVVNYDLPVSYTHLDVYKRQDLDVSIPDGVRSLELRGIAFYLDGEILEGAQPYRVVFGLGLVDFLAESFQLFRGHAFIMVPVHVVLDFRVDCVLERTDVPPFQASLEMPRIAARCV